MDVTVNIKRIEDASKRLEGVVKKTPLILSKRLSAAFGGKVYLKREDLQEVRSYKIRGAYNCMSLLDKEQRKKGVVTASAGNHAQGVAYSAAMLNIRATIFMPQTTPLQKLSRVQHFGGKLINIELVGQTFDESYKAALGFAKKQKALFVHPFDNYNVIAGQGTVGKEIYDKLGINIDYLICPIGGGGLISGVGTYLHGRVEKLKIIGAEPNGAAGMHASIKNGHVLPLARIDTFVDGAAVAKVGDKTFSIVSKIVDKIVLVAEGKVCTAMIELYQNDGIVAEPAGALAVAALDAVANRIRGKTVVCILSGGNNDILRYPEIMEKSLVHQGLKHYFLIEFAQKPGQLRQFVDKALGPGDDITRFEYIKKNAKEMGPALVGIELSKTEDFEGLTDRMQKLGIRHTLITNDDTLYGYLI